MKLLFVKNRYTKKLKLNTYLDWFKKHTPISFTTEEISTDLDLTTKFVGNETYKQAAVVGDDVYSKLKGVIPEGKYDIVVLVYGNKLDGIRANFTPFEPLYFATDLIQLCTTTDNGKKLNHEIFHTFFHRLTRQMIAVQDPMDVCIYEGVRYNYFNNDNLSLRSPSNRTIALENLKPFWDNVSNMPPNTQNAPTEPTTPKKYRYFTNSEIAGLKPELCEKLDKARDFAGIPFKLTSTLRDPEKNTAAGGVQNSAHLKGEAVDIACTHGNARWQIVNSLFMAGFNRIGIGETFVHADISKELPQKVIFHYYK